VLYLDNAATSFPKPPEVAAAIADFLNTSAGNPGRSGHHLSMAAHQVVAETRRALAGVLGVPDPHRLAFMVNATDALNTAIHGVLRPGDRVVSTGMEHNAVARPLHAAGGQGVEVRIVPCGRDGSLDLADLERELVAAPTRLVVMTHASNVTGGLFDVAEATAIAHRHGALILVDAAQTAGVVPIDVAALGVDLLAVTGHKGLLGPTGTGALFVGEGLQLTPLRQGGTGSHSELLNQPGNMPDALEAGTLNTVGIAGLGAALKVIQRVGVAELRRHELAVTAELVSGLRGIDGVVVHGPSADAREVAVVSITVAGWEPTDLAAALDSSFGIAVRAGLHCAPLAHQSIGTFPGGTVRLSPGLDTTADGIAAVLTAIGELAACG
jgi:cysteine desulfurase family protein